MKFVQLYKLLFENKAISSLVDNADFQNLLYQYGRNSKFRDFLAMWHLHDIDIKTGKRGVLVIRDYIAPVKIVDIIMDNNEKGLVLEKTDGSNFEDMTYLIPPFTDRSKKHVIVYDKFFYSIIPEKTFSIISKWLVFLKNTNELNELLSDTELQKLSLDSIDLLKTTDATLENLKNKVFNITLKRDINRGKSNTAGPEGRTVLDFNDGWKWVSLDKEYCSKEGAAAGHCGNAGGLKSENILSLRDDNNRIHITAVVNNKISNEFKGVGNRKPLPYTHKYIIGLLLDTKLIDEIGEGKYMPENDFQLDDLSSENINKLIKAGFLDKTWKKSGSPRIESNDDPEWLNVLKNDPAKFEKYYKDHTGSTLPKFEYFDNSTEEFVLDSDTEVVGLLNDDALSRLSSIIYNKTGSDQDYDIHKDVINNKSFKKWLTDLSSKYRNSQAQHLPNPIAILMRMGSKDSQKTIFLRKFLSHVYYYILEHEPIHIPQFSDDFKLIMKFNGRINETKNVNWKVVYNANNEDIQDIEDINSYGTYERKGVKEIIDELKKGGYILEGVISKMNFGEILEIMDNVATLYPFYKKIKI